MSVANNPAAGLERTLSGHRERYEKPVIASISNDVTVARNRLPRLMAQDHGRIEEPETDRRHDDPIHRGDPSGEADAVGA
jgi:hypothetical protein